MADTNGSDRSNGPRFRVLEGGSTGPETSRFEEFLEREAHRRPPLVKAAVMGRRRPDVAPTDEEGDGYLTERQVADRAGVSGRELRSWVDACPFLQPLEGATMRVFTVEDAELVLVIRDLIREHGLTLDEARRHVERRYGFRSASE